MARKVRSVPEDMHEEDRQGVIIGINEYNDLSIPKLAGAVNDATDICKRLKDFGNFKVTNDHFLIDKEATGKAIRKAISDLLWQPDPCDLALFYFSGHGFVDGYGNGYIAPYDMLKQEPFVCGIDMPELKKIILNSVNKSIVLIILDCAYSGILTKGDKSIPDAKAPFDSYFRNLNLERGGEGKIIIASSEGGHVSKEINIKHENEQEPHPHGVFTFYLLEGLDGKAADQTGIITLEGLYKYVENQLAIKGKQEPKFFATGDTQMGRIKIAVAPLRYSYYVQKKIEEAESFYSESDPTLLILAADTINAVLEINPKNEKALDLKNRTNIALTKYQELVSYWLLNNEQNFRFSIPNIFPELERLTGFLDFDKIRTVDTREKSLLANLCKVSEETISSDVFIKRCKSFENPPIISKPIIDGFKK
jgi:hypothetical protein